MIKEEWFRDWKIGDRIIHIGTREEFEVVDIYYHEDYISKQTKEEYALKNIYTNEVKVIDKENALDYMYSQYMLKEAYCERKKVSFFF